MNSRGNEGRLPSPSPSLSRPARKCSLGCPILDSFLNGGIPCGSITELVGECGSAKTQICLQLLLCAQMPLSQGGLHASSLYIYTESYFPSKRLQQLAKSFLHSGKLGPAQFPSKRKLDSLQNSAPGNFAEVGCAMVSSLDNFNPNLDHQHSHAKYVETSSVLQSHGHDIAAGKTKKDLVSRDLSLHHSLSVLDKADNLHNLKNLSNDGTFETHGNLLSSQQETSVFIDNNNGELEDPCDNIFVQSIQNIKELCTFLDQVHVLLSRSLAMPVRLLIIDSVAALFRADFDNNAKDLAMRTEWFFKLSSKLKQYAHDHDIAVLVTNQVVDDVESESSETSNSVSAMLSGKLGPLISAGRRVIPALGIGWSHCVNTRIFLSRTYVPDKQPCSYHQRTESTSECSSNLHAKSVDCGGMVSEPHISVLQQLESELPDDLLLTLPHQRSVPSYSGVYEKPIMVPNGENKETSEVLNYTSWQDLHPSRNNWSSNSKSLPSSTVRRDLRIVFAPHLPISSCEFAVTAAQIYGVSAAFPMPGPYKKAM